jgi:hypothetical protein
MMAARLAACEEIAEPWPHAILDDFLPAEVFAELLANLPAAKDGARTRDLPASVLTALAACEDAIRYRWNFAGCKASLELIYRTRAIAPHNDREDKFWSGILYVAGDPVGTELYDAEKRLAKVVEFAPNRLLCWGHRRELHAVPASRGRFGIQFWMMR